MVWGLSIWAQPGNTSCSSAVQLCAQQAAPGTNTGAVGSIPSQCQPTDNVVWYTFTTNSMGGEVNIQLTDIDCATIPGMGDELAMVVVGGTCEPPDFPIVTTCLTGDEGIDMITPALAPNTTYWVLISGTMPPGGGQAAQCTFNITVSGPGMDVHDVDLIISEDVIIGIGESTQLHVSGGSNPVWSPTSGLSNANIHDPIASPASTTTYTVSVEMNGCIYTAQVVVEVIRRILPPNTFTPNGDGKNDIWQIIGMDDYPGAEVSIYDRWGQRVYSSTGYREPWDGTFNGARLPDATYYYHIQLNQLEGRAPPYTGFVSIVR